MMNDDLSSGVDGPFLFRLLLIRCHCIYGVSSLQFVHWQSCVFRNWYVLLLVFSSHSMNEQSLATRSNLSRWIHRQCFVFSFQNQCRSNSNATGRLQNQHGEEWQSKSLMCSKEDVFSFVFCRSRQFHRRICQSLREGHQSGAERHHSRWLSRLCCLVSASPSIVTMEWMITLRLASMNSMRHRSSTSTCNCWIRRGSS